MYCSNCGKENKDEANYCWNCGEELNINFDDTSDSNVNQNKSGDDVNARQDEQENASKDNKDSVKKSNESEVKKPHFEKENTSKEIDLDYDKDGFVKPQQDDQSTSKSFKYYLVKFFLILLAIILPPLGAILVIKSNKFSKIGKGASIIWVSIIIIAFIAGPPENDEEDLAEEEIVEETVEETSEEAAPETQDELEETEELPPSEKDIDNYVDYLVEDTMGHSTNMGYTRLIDFWTEGHNNEKLVLRLQGDENFTSNMTRDGMIDNTEQVITQLYSERDDINNFEVQWYMVLIDERGNEENTQVVNIEFDRANYNNVNWDNFLTSNLPDIANYYWVHPAYR